MNRLLDGCCAITALVLINSIAPNMVLASENTPDNLTAVDQPLNAENSTKAWLELQRSGRNASSNKQTLSGPVMKKVHERYIESFALPMPDLAVENAKKSD